MRSHHTSSVQRGLFRRYPSTALLLLLLCTAAMGSGCSSRAVISDVSKQPPLTPDMTPVLISLQGTREKSFDGQFDETVDCADRNEILNTFTVRFDDRNFFSWCSRVVANGVDATLHDAGESQEWQDAPIYHYPDRNRYGVMAPLDAVVTAERFAGEIHRDYRRQSHFKTLKISDETLMVQPRDHWVSESDGCLDAVTVGWRTMVTHDSDNNARNFVLCADVFLVNRPRPESGKVIARHWRTKLPCSVGVPGGSLGQKRYFLFTYKEGKENENDPWPPCTSNTTEAIELESVPSATRILLTDDVGCEKEDPVDLKDLDRVFWIELRTTNKITTVNEIQLDEILTHSKGDIVRPGLLLVDSYLRPGLEANRRLSCIKVTTSVAPPST